MTTEAEAFWANVDRENYGHCWIWGGKIHRTGYGQLRWNGRPAYAHRAAYEIVTGTMPIGCALKKRAPCTDKLCVRPEHWVLEVFVSPMHIIQLEKRRDRLKKELEGVESRLALYQRQLKPHDS